MKRMLVVTARSASRPGCERQVGIGSWIRVVGRPHPLTCLVEKMGPARYGVPCQR